MLIKIQKKSLCSVDVGAGKVLLGNLYKGKTNQINMAVNIPITPPNLFGQARNIA